MKDDDAAVKESRRILRLVHEHLLQAHLNVGAAQQSLGLVDLIYHPTSALGHLNYVMPRRNTAWIPGPQVAQGLERMRALDRTPRVNYVEGLFPPLFARTLRELGLVVEQETPIMVCKINGSSPADEPAPEGITTAQVDTQEGIALWWYVWRNAFYDVLTGGIEPINIGRDMRAVTLGQQADLLLYRHGFPVGAARVTFHETTAHLTTLAIMKEARTPELVRLLHRAAIKIAAQRRCDLIFTSGHTQQDQRLCRDSGFLDSGSIVCYAEPSGPSGEEAHDDSLAQPVFAL